MPSEPNHRLTEDRVGKRARVRAKEKAILVGLDTKFMDDRRGLWGIEESMEELKSLSRTAGVQVLATVTQRKTRPDPTFFIGRGKADQLKEMVGERGADVLIFNDELSPAQSRNLEERIGRKIVDRPQLIMDIFAQRAATKEAKLQVELAQLEYLLPRLRGWGEALERLGGGIGTRGPGETRLEQDRQKIQRRIESIRDKLEGASKEWEIRRKRRKKNSIPEVAIVGYTNTGKTTLLNKLTGSEGFIEDKLFATLDPLTRRLTLPDKRDILLIDTVGFIRKLPHQLIPAFRSTLKSAKTASLLINVMDVRKDQLPARWQTVNQILNEDVFEDPKERPPLINVLNKVDLLEEKGGLLQLKNNIDHSIEVSAKEGTNIDQLKEMIAEMLGDSIKSISLEIPYSEADLVEWFHENGEVESEHYQSGRIQLQGKLEEHLLSELKRKMNHEGSIEIRSS